MLVLAAVILAQLPVPGRKQAKAAAGRNALTASGQKISPALVKPGRFCYNTPQIIMGAL